jgi:hypothetical protein
MNTRCFCCGIETTNPKYCSRSCAAKVSNKIPKRKTTRKCLHCNSIVRNYRSTLCEQHYQLSKNKSRETLENLTIADYQSRDCIKNQHISSKSAHIRGLARSWFKDMTNLPCANCKYSKHVEICHIKPIASFEVTAKIKEVNYKENLIQLCPNCHWEFDNGHLVLT